MKMPNLGEAHCGEGALQSQQRLLLASFWIARSCDWVENGGQLGIKVGTGENG